MVCVMQRRGLSTVSSALYKAAPLSPLLLCTMSECAAGRYRMYDAVCLVRMSSRLVWVAK